MEQKYTFTTFQSQFMKSKRQRQSQDLFYLKTTVTRYQKTDSLSLENLLRLQVKHP